MQRPLRGHALDAPNIGHVGGDDVIVRIVFEKENKIVNSYYDSGFGNLISKYSSDYFGSGPDRVVSVTEKIIDEVEILLLAPAKCKSSIYILSKIWL